MCMCSRGLYFDRTKFDWVISVPGNAYKEKPAEKVKELYENMAVKEFDKQFASEKEKTTSRELVLKKDYISDFFGPEYFYSEDDKNFCTHCGTKTIKKYALKLNETKIDVALGKWKDMPAGESFLNNFVYTIPSRDDYPLGEAIRIVDRTEKGEIAQDLKKFYKRFKWKSRIYNDGAFKLDEAENEIYLITAMLNLWSEAE